MIKATDISIFIVMGVSLIILILESISNRQFKAGLSEKPHIRLLAIGTLIICFLLIFVDLVGQSQLSKRPLLFINQISSLFLVVNTAIAIFIGRKTLINSQNGEVYFLILAALALAISNITASSLLLKLIMSVGWFVSMTTLAIIATERGKKAEIGLKLVFTTIIIILQMLLALFLLNKAGYPIDLKTISIMGSSKLSPGFLGIILIALTGLSLASVPPFHFGHVDCADGADLSSAFLLLSNSFIMGGVLLLQVKDVLDRSGFNTYYEANILGFMLAVGFMILWLRALDQSKIRRTAAYIATSIGPLFSMSMLFGASVLLPKLVFLLTVYSFVTLTLFALYGSLAYMDPINLPWQTFEDMSGFGRSGPLQTLTFLVAISSIAGLPGTMGYFVKLSLIAPLKESIVFSGAIFLSIAIGAACAMRVFVFMFSKHAHIKRFAQSYPRPPLAVLFASLVLVVLGFFPFVR